MSFKKTDEEIEHIRKNYGEAAVGAHLAYKLIMGFIVLFFLFKFIGCCDGAEDAAKRMKPIQNEQPSSGVINP